jgi:hypothetical protein
LKQGNQSRAGTERNKGNNCKNGEKKKLKRLGPGIRKECRNGKETRISYISCTDIFQNKNRNNKRENYGTGHWTGTRTKFSTGTGTRTWLAFPARTEANKQDQNLEQRLKK